MTPSTMEGTLITLFTTGLGLTSGKVEWAFQNPTRPAAPFCAVERIGFKSVGLPAHMQSNTPGTPPAGQEVTLSTRQTCELVYRLNYYGPAAFFTMNALATYLHSESAKEALKSVDVGLARVGDVRSVPQLFRSTYEDRAMFDIKLNASLTHTELTGYIAHVTGSHTITDSGTSVTVPWSFDLP